MRERLTSGKATASALSAAGPAIAVVLATALLSGTFERLLFGVRPTDRLTFSAVTVLLVAVAVCAAAIPARRAARVDPSVALQAE